MKKLLRLTLLSVSVFYNLPLQSATTASSDAIKKELHQGADIFLARGLDKQQTGANFLYATPARDTKPWLNSTAKAIIYAQQGNNSKIQKANKLLDTTSTSIARVYNIIVLLFKIMDSLNKINPEPQEARFPEYKEALKEMGIGLTADWFNVLGLKADSSNNEIEQAYRALARKWHPDRCKPDKKAVCTEAFTLISAAREMGLEIVRPEPLGTATILKFIDQIKKQLKLPIKATTLPTLKLELQNLGAEQLEKLEKLRKQFAALSLPQTKFSSKSLQDAQSMLVALGTYATNIINKLRDGFIRNLKYFDPKYTEYKGKPSTGKDIIVR